MCLNDYAFITIKSLTELNRRTNVAPICKVHSELLRRYFLNWGLFQTPLDFWWRFFEVFDGLISDWSAEHKRFSAQYVFTFPFPLSLQTFHFRFLLNLFSAYLRCTTDLKCASRIVRSHSNAFAQDCNGDGLVTCDDYAMMHRNGGYQCSNPLTNTDYWKIYNECKVMITSRGENI